MSGTTDSLGNKFLEDSEFGSEAFKDKSWAEPEKSEINLDEIMSQPERKTGYDFKFLFCFLSRINLTPLLFLKYFFYVEIGISCAAVVGSLVALLYGLTYFTIATEYDRDNQLIGMTCGTSGIVFSFFKFYFTLVSLKNLKREVFVAEIACAAGLSILTHAVLVVVCFTFFGLALIVGFKDVEDAEGGRGGDEDYVERDFGLALLVTSVPMLFLAFTILGQSMMMKKVSKAVDQYMLEYIHSSKVRRERREIRRKERARQMRAATGL